MDAEYKSVSVRMRALRPITAFALVFAAFATVGQNAGCDSSIQTASSRISDEDLERLGMESRETTRRRVAEQMERDVRPRLRDANVEPVSWETMATILLDFESIRPGETTRAEVDAKLRPSAGFSSLTAVTMVHPLCRFCKMDIEYSYRRNPADQCRVMVSGDDVVFRTSVPYIDWPRLD